MPTYSNQFTAEFRVPNQQPDAALRQWTEAHPAWLPEHYKVIDGSYNTVTWQWRHTQPIMRIIPFAAFFGGQTVYRITARFATDGGLGSVVTVNGQGEDKILPGIQAAADSYLAGGTI
jgi:hypothetical protein